MPKPIVVLYIPSADFFNISLPPSELMAAFNDIHYEIKMPPMFYDYLWFVFVDEESDVPRLQVFHEKDYTKEQYDDLYKMLQEGIGSLKNKDNESNSGRSL